LSKRFRGKEKRAQNAVKDKYDFINGDKSLPGPSFDTTVLSCYFIFFRDLKQPNFIIIKIDGLVKSRETPLPVIPAKAGIQLYQMVPVALDSGFHRSDNFLRDHQN